MKVTILDTQEDYNYKNFFKMIRARLQHERFDGTMSPEVERVVFERGNSVGVLLYDAAEDTVILTKQFRYPAYRHAGPGWLLEIVAGVQEEGEEPLFVAQRELIEEVGYALERLHPLGQFYLSPGGSSEIMHLYLGYLKHAARVSEGGGVIAEHEDIQVVRLPCAEAFAMLERGEIQDAKTIIALQHLQRFKRSAV